MKKKIVWMVVSACSTWAIAGGDIGVHGATTQAVASHNCKKDRVYKDQRQQLLWQDQAYTNREIGATKRNKSTGKAGSQKYASRYCQRLNYAGYSDWRLPTSDELAIVHAPQGEDFFYSQGNDFWSSTPAVDGKYYVVFPADAMRYARNPKESNYIRCVRCINTK